MTTNPSSLTYRATGVLDNSELGLRALLKWVNRTQDFRRTRDIGRQVLDVGFFANVVDIGHNLGLALCTDGVGSKVLIAEMVGRYDTIGIDCIAMNVNDAICVGAEPFSFLDYIAIERATPEILEEIGKGLYEGARLAGVNIVGGEISQIPDIIKGEKSGLGLDLVGMCAAFVPLDKIIVGQNTRPGDIIIGVRSSGIHSNGLTLARRALLQLGGLKQDEFIRELGCTVGDELLKPTHIYVQPVLELLKQHAPIRALINITSDGFLNLARIVAPVSFTIDRLPKPQPIFDLIQRVGNIAAPEMYRVFNMGIGFCVIVPDDADAIRATKTVFAAHSFEAAPIGHVTHDKSKHVFLTEQNLIGAGDSFRPSV